MREKASLEALKNQDLERLCYLALHTASAGKFEADWKHTRASKRRFLGSVPAPLLERYVAFAGAWDRLCVPRSHAERLREFPDKFARELLDVFIADCEDQIDEDDAGDVEDAELADILDPQDSRLLLKWIRFDSDRDAICFERGESPRSTTADRKKSGRRSVRETTPKRNGSRGSREEFDASLVGVGGLREVRDALYEQVYLPLMRPDLTAEYGVRPSLALLFHGPPGVGKTRIAQCLATSADIDFTYVGGPELLSQWIGNTEQSLRRLFTRAKAKRRAIIFFDEIDTLGANRDQLQCAESGYVQQLLALLDGLESRNSVAVIGATNRLDAIDPALLRPGRFTPVEVSMPCAEDRLEILRIHLEKTPLGDSVPLDAIAKKTEGASGAAIKQLCDAAAMAALRRHMATGKPQQVSEADMEFAWHRMTRSKNPGTHHQAKQRSNIAGSSAPDGSQVNSLSPCHGPRSK